MIALSSSFCLLVQTAAAGVARSAVEWIHIPAAWPGRMELWTACERMGPVASMLMIALGIVYGMFGFSFYRYLITLNAAVIGTVLGIVIGQKLGGGALPGAILGGFSAAAVTWPLMRWAVAVMGGLFGAVLGGSIWQLAEQDPHFLWCGAMMGLIACGLFCFILFKGSVVAYTSMQGAMMVVIGLLGLASKYSSVADAVGRSLQGKPFLLPMAVFIAAVSGIMYQQNTTPQPAGPPPPPKK